MGLLTLTKNLFPSKFVDDLTMSNTLLLTEVSTHLLNHLSSKLVDSTESSKTVSLFQIKKIYSVNIIVNVF